jgi:hypothetical protein
MRQMGKNDVPSLLDETTEVLHLIKDLRLAMEVNSASVPEKFDALGHKVNMMALKAALVLSGAHFSEKDQRQDGK